MRSAVWNRELLGKLGDMIDGVLDKKKNLTDGVTSDNCAKLVACAAKAEDPLGGIDACPILPVRPRSVIRHVADLLSLISGSNTLLWWCLKLC